MDRDRKANIRCTWFTQIDYVHGVDEFSLIVDVASFLEVLFLHPGVVSLTGGDAQGNVSIRDTNHVVGVPQVAELGDLLKEVTDKVSNQSSKQSVPNQKFDFEFQLIVLILPILQAA
ncbi:hypothetical protein ACFX19_010236 [Malus domestica]